jgi:hypothetical protein
VEVWLLRHVFIDPAREEFCPTKEKRLARKRPEVILTDKQGALLEVDALAYPEDKNLIVDPYAVLEEQQATMGELIARAEATLPRPLGEIIPAQAKGLSATWLYRLVLLDFDKQPHCRAETVEETLRQLIWQVASLKVHRLGLDRFELLEPCISAYRVMSCLCDQVTKLEAAGSSPPTTLIFSIHQDAAMRRYQLALANLD